MRHNHLTQVLMNSSNKSHYSSKPRTITMIECLGIQYLIPTPIKTPNLSQYTTNKLDLNNNNNNNLDKLVGNSETQLRSPQNKTLLKKTVDSDLFDDDDDGLVDVVCEELYHVLSSVEQLKCDNSPIVIHCELVFVSNLHVSFMAFYFMFEVLDLYYFLSAIK